MPPTARPEGQLRELSQALLDMTRVTSDIAARTLADQEELTVLQFRALVVLADVDSARVATLADALHVSPSTATRLCDRLVAKGLIARSRSLEDRREVQVVLADAGRFLVEEVTRQRLSVIRGILAGIDPERYEGMLDAFSLFTRAAHPLHGVSPSEQ